MDLLGEVSPKKPFTKGSHEYSSPGEKAFGGTPLQRGHPQRGCCASAVVLAAASAHLLLKEWRCRAGLLLDVPHRSHQHPCHFKWCVEISAKSVHELQRQNNLVLCCVGIWTYIKHFGEKAMNVTMSSL
jgi:hypothetical protein